MLKKTVLVHALTLAFSAAALSIGAMDSAMAQSNAAGVIYGQVPNPAGATVTLTNTDTGLKRTVNVESNGTYRVPGLPVGHYKVDLVRNGSVVRSTEVDAIIGQGVDASFGEVTRVEVSGRRSRIDVTNATNGAVFTSKELAALPVAQNVSSIIQLAPNTTRADPRYAAGASFGGGGASENAYYVNGFPVTNPLTQLGASELPFGAIQQAEVMTGGFGAEFGRSIGGVVNITTKAGTNRWDAGATYSIDPNSTRAKARNVYYANTGVINPATKQPYDGTLYARNDQSTAQETRTGAYVGGPIIQDKLFMFVAAERIDAKRSGVARTSDTAVTTLASSGWLDRENITTRWVGKLDWNITDNHRIEYTNIGDKPKSDRRSSDYDYTTGAHTGKVSSGGSYESVANITPTIGAKTNILRYAGTITEDLTVSALIGQNKSDHIQNLVGYNPAVPGIVASSANRAPGLTYNNPQPFAGQNLDQPYSYDKVKAKRLDVEYKLGDHLLRAGLDDVKLQSYGAGQATAGGFTWTYGRTSTPNTPISLTGNKVAVNNGQSPLAADGYYVRKTIFNDVTAAFSNQSAQYIEDRWQATKNLLVTAGLRVEQYENLNGDGVPFLKMNDQVNPRLSAVWDVRGDSSLKVFGSAGRYSIQIPTHVAIRGASRSTFTQQYFTYTGVAGDGQPTGLVALTPVSSSNNEFGQAKLAETVAAQNLKPSYQDELTLGFEQAFSPDLNFGAKFTYRKLRTTIDDFCDGRPFDAWAAAHNVDTSKWDGFGCASINPGETNDFLVDFNGTGKNFTKVTLTAKDMGFDKPKRTYAALDLFLEHPMRNGWYGRVNYTWSRNKGNTEGQTLSAVAQTDVAATQTWDMPEIMEYADGRLPNDRTHQIKAFGFWQVLPEWTLGGNFLAASGMPITCLGNYPIAKQTDGFPDYGSAYHYCFGQTSTTNVPSPQGAAGDLPWDIRLDASLAYAPAMLKGLEFKVNVFNVFNRQTVQQVDQTYNTGGNRSPTYFTPGAFVGYTEPRHLQFMVTYNRKF
jgi:hypothetical protein